MVRHEENGTRAKSSEKVEGKAKCQVPTMCLVREWRQSSKMNHSMPDKSEEKREGLYHCPVICQIVRCGKKASIQAYLGSLISWIGMTLPRLGEGIVCSDGNSIFFSWGVSGRGFSHTFAPTIACVNCHGW